MDNTVIYIIVFVALAHFVVAVIFLLHKLTGPVKDKPVETSSAHSDQPSAKGVDAA